MRRADSFLPHLPIQVSTSLTIASLSSLTPSPPIYFRYRIQTYLCGGVTAGIWEQVDLADETKEWECFTVPKGAEISCIVKIELPSTDLEHHVEEKVSLAGERGGL